ncbi:hypothetical protein KQX54_007052 [Cotesia glomerata]|uniref:Uncharacterized protein n=1 Tax=Cotesia glomerata TaxID=32391 RepID=A0AAV7HTH5_COTGL|nr:hypothetical protein KQX54_007052 [Cotesia glomerata]
MNLSLGLETFKNRQAHNNADDWSINGLPSLADGQNPNIGPLMADEWPIDTVSKSPVIHLASHSANGWPINDYRWFADN